MKLAQDKIVHLKGGALVLLFTLAAGVALWLIGLHWLSICFLVSGFVAGASVEGAQASDNQAAAAAGLPKPHEVSPGDLAASAAPCWLMATAVQVAAYFGALPVNF